MRKLVLLRHGESLWNVQNRFTGWTDVDLSSKGEDEARKAGISLKNNGFFFDKAFTSLLKRAIRTLWIILDEMDLMWIPVERSWRLNERHYGKLQGLNKEKTAVEFGAEQVHIWRRSYDVPPPPVSRADSRYPGKDPRYFNVPADELPVGESLKDTVERFLPYWENSIKKELLKGKELLIVAHGNSLRGLVKHLDKISDENIAEVDLPTGRPLVYELDEKLVPLKHYYLGNE